MDMNKITKKLLTSALFLIPFVGTASVFLRGIEVYPKNNLVKNDIVVTENFIGDSGFFMDRDGRVFRVNSKGVKMAIRHYQLVVAEVLDLEKNPEAMNEVDRFYKDIVHAVDNSFFEFLRTSPESHKSHALPLVYLGSSGTFGRNESHGSVYSPQLFSQELTYRGSIYPSLADMLAENKGAWDPRHYEYQGIGLGTENRNVKYYVQHCFINDALLQELVKRYFEADEKKNEIYIYLLQHGLDTRYAQYVTFLSVLKDFLKDIEEKRLADFDNNYNDFRDLCFCGARFLEKNGIGPELLKSYL